MTEGDKVVHFINYIVMVLGLGLMEFIIVVGIIGIIVMSIIMIKEDIWCE